MESTHDHCDNTQQVNGNRTHGDNPHKTRDNRCVSADCMQRIFDGLATEISSEFSAEIFIFGSFENRGVD